MMSTMSIRSAVNAVNLVNAVNAVQYAPPPGGVAKAKHDITFALIPSDDFGEIIDNASAKVAGSWLIKVDGTWNVPTTL